MNHSDSTDRTIGDYILFALAFFGFLLAAGGIVVGSAPGAITGAILLLLPILCFSARSSPGE
jgi:hypothetical protein